MKQVEEYKRTTNPTVWRRLHKQIQLRKMGGCDYCPWHDGENTHGKKDRKRHKASKYRGKIAIKFKQWENRIIKEREAYFEGAWCD